MNPPISSEAMTFLALIENTLANHKTDTTQKLITPAVFAVFFLFSDDVGLAVHAPSLEGFGVSNTHDLQHSMRRL